WIVAFTLFPALQIALRTPTRSAERSGERWPRLIPALISFAHRQSFALVGAALAVCAAGIVALFGIPGHLAPMSVGVDTLTYLDPTLPARRDLLWFRENVADLN